MEKQTLKLTDEGVNSIYAADFYEEGDGQLALALINKIDKTVKTRKSKEDDLLKYDIWHHCRETFAKVFRDKCYSILFCHGEGLGVNIENFVNDIEKSLNIDLNLRSKFYRVEGNSMVTAIKVSPFWADKGTFARQIFTIIIRNGREHKIGSNFWDTLKENEYSSIAIPAIQLFFEGYYNFAQSMYDKLEEHVSFGFVFHLGHMTRGQIIENKLMFI